MSRPRSNDENPPGKKRRGVIDLDVGGKVYRTGTTTLSTNSSYFCSMFSREWRIDDGEIFVDQDPEPFSILLSYMRLGCIKSKDIDEKVLLQAEYFGIERLVSAVKCIAFWNMNPEFDGSEEEAVFKFNEEYIGIREAVSNGILPLYISKRKQGRKEYANLNIVRRDCADFEENGYGELVAVLFAPRHIVEKAQGNNTNEEERRRLVRNGNHVAEPAIVNGARDEGNVFKARSCAVKNCPTFLDALNWLSKHGFSTLETDVDSRRDKGHMAVEVDLIVSLTFSKEVRIIRQQCEPYQVIIDENRHLMKEVEKDFAVVVPIARDCGYVKADIGETVPRGHSLEINALSNISLIQNMIRFHHKMNWLQRELYVERESSLLEEAYLTMLIESSMDDIEHSRGVMIFSRKAKSTYICNTK